VRPEASTASARATAALPLAARCEVFELNQLRKKREARARDEPRRQASRAAQSGGLTAYVEHRDGPDQAAAAKNLAEDSLALMLQQADATSGRLGLSFGVGLHERCRFTVAGKPGVETVASLLRPYQPLRFEDDGSCLSTGHIRFGFDRGHIKVYPSRPDFNLELCDRVESNCTLDLRRHIAKRQSEGRDVRPLMGSLVGTPGGISCHAEKGEPGAVFGLLVMVDAFERDLQRKLVVAKQPSVDADFLERVVAQRRERATRDLGQSRTLVDPSLMAAAVSDPASNGSSDSVEGRLATILLCCTSSDDGLHFVQRLVRKSKVKGRECFWVVAVLGGTCARFYGRIGVEGHPGSFQMKVLDFGERGSAAAKGVAATFAELKLRPTSERLAAGTCYERVASIAILGAFSSVRAAADSGDVSDDDDDDDDEIIHEGAFRADLCDVVLDDGDSWSDLGGLGDRGCFPDEPDPAWDTAAAAPVDPGAFEFFDLATLEHGSHSLPKSPAKLSACADITNRA
jgi:predicted DNA-binding WGR domain protein